MKPDDVTDLLAQYRDTMECQQRMRAAVEAVTRAYVAQHGGTVDDAIRNARARGIAGTDSEFQAVIWNMLVTGELGFDDLLDLSARQSEERED